MIVLTRDEAFLATRRGLSKKQDIDLLVEYNIEYRRSTGTNVVVVGR